MTSEEAFGYIAWLEDSAKRKNQPIDELVIELRAAAEAFWGKAEQTEEDVPF